MAVREGLIILFYNRSVLLRKQDIFFASKIAACCYKNRVGKHKAHRYDSDVLIGVQIYIPNAGYTPLESAKYRSCTSNSTHGLQRSNRQRRQWESTVWHPDSKQYKCNPHKKFDGNRLDFGRCNVVCVCVWFCKNRFCIFLYCGNKDTLLGT